MEVMEVNERSGPGEFHHLYHFHHLHRLYHFRNCDSAPLSINPASVAMGRSSR